MLDQTERIKQILSDQAETKMRGVRLCATQRHLLDTFAHYIGILEASDASPIHADMFRYLMERFEASINKYNEPHKPF
jgi:hypothetical protein